MERNYIISTRQRMVVVLRIQDISINNLCLMEDLAEKNTKFARNHDNISSTVDGPVHTNTRTPNVGNGWAVILI